MRVINNFGGKLFIIGVVIPRDRIFLEGEIFLERRQSPITKKVFSIPKKKKRVL